MHCRCLTPWSVKFGCRDVRHRHRTAGLPYGLAVRPKYYELPVGTLDCSPLCLCYPLRVVSHFTGTLPGVSCFLTRHLLDSSANSMRKLSLSFSAAVLIPVLVSSCVSVTQVPVSIQESADRFVRLEGQGDRYRTGSNRFEHPLNLSVEEWERILSSIQVQGRKDTFIFTTAKNPPEPAFLPEQAANLSPGLSKAFSRAHPDEFVVFGFSETRFPPVIEITTGGWFVEGQRLHLILANYRHSVSMKHVRDQLWQDPMHSHASPSYDLVAAPNQSFGRQKSLADLLSGGAPELLIDYTTLLETTPVAPPSPSPTGSPKVASPPGMPPESALEERLRVLKKLRAEGLITEEEYRDKKKQLLDRF
jgi:hypothetical protein